jgi:uncharacterized protein YdiU (UPF0061 family)
MDTVSSPLTGLAFDDRFVRTLPGDPDPTPRSREVLGAAYTPVSPTRVAAPRLVAASDEVLDLLGIPREAAQTPEFAEVFAGNRLLPGMRPYAANYGGHQFGVWAGQLGDGRAITLGELLAPGGGRWELQLKGAGPTPYSRRADGRAVLRSSVREFLCSEAMAHLGVPTTRALSLVTTGEPVLRDMFYDGNPQDEPGAVVCRVAPSFLRFGNYEIFAHRGERELLASLVEHTLTAHFPELGPLSPASVVAMLHEVAARSARLAAHWMRVGFVHGVLNTDNMSILGLTLDYGPYGWLESFDPDWTPNTTDAGRRRYRFGQQPAVVGWNLTRLAEALYPLVGEAEPLEGVLERYRTEAERELQDMWRAKLGLLQWRPETDPALLSELMVVLRLVETDYPLFFRDLARVDPTATSDAALLEPLRPSFYAPPDEAATRRIAAWVRAWDQRALQDEPDRQVRRARMDQVNPRFVLRNWLAQQAIDEAAGGDPSGVHELLDVLRRPYDEQPGRESFAERRPEWARHRAGCSMLSCSS